MNELNNFAMEVYEGRRNVVKKYANIVDEVTKQHIVDILKIFKISNEDETTLLVWKVKLNRRKDGKLGVMIAFEKGEGVHFYSEKILEPNNILGINENAILRNHISGLDISAAMFERIYSYANSTIGKYFKISRNDNKYIVFELK